jgi:hypothetical protein
MVATGETISETKLCGSRPGNLRFLSRLCGEKSGPMNSELGIWNTLIHKEAVEVNEGDVTMATEHWPRI